MSRIAVIMKREFLEFVQTKTFIIMTLIGPLLIAGFIALEVFILTRGGGGEYTMAIVDQSSDGIGAAFEQDLKHARGFMGKPVTFTTSRIERPANLAAVRDSLDGRVSADSLGGYLVIPAGVLTGETVTYYGKNATNEDLTELIEKSLQNVVQTTRLSQEGIDPAKVAGALKEVPFKAEKTTGRGMRGNAAAAQIMAMLMGFAIYLVIALYGAAIMNGVLEEKRDKIVEVIVSAVRAPQLLVGKVLGIGAAGFLQMLVWAASVGLVIAYAGSIAAILDLGPEKAAMVNALTGAIPQVPLSVGAVFLFFFLGGFLIYSTVYATIGSIATTNQEAQQLVFPAVLPLIIGFLMANAALRNADAQMAKIGSLLPFTSPLVMPVRAVLGSASAFEIVLSFVLLVATAFVMLWLAGKVYRVGIFATGKRPTMKEVARWIRAA
ncbi:MAG: ABC transporter permease [Gemmatimonadota bacterium]